MSVDSAAYYRTGCDETTSKDFAAAASSFQKALELRPGWPEAKHNLGRAWFELGRTDQAIALFREALSASNLELPQTAIAVIGPASAASNNQTILDDRRAWAKRFLPTAEPRRLHPSGAKIQIGYISAFFASDNWMKPVWALINQHDRSQFDIHLFSDDAASEIKHGYRPNGSDQFHHIQGLDADAAAARIEAAKIDILVDLNGYSAPPRLRVLALKPAPIIAAWFNMYATSGMSCYDYLIGDDTVIPPSEEQFYCEKILRVPGTYLTFDVAYPVPPVAEPPCLKTGAITFGCLAPQHKINPAVIDAWCRILRKVPASRLILRNGILDSPGNRKFVEALFQDHGIDAERLRLLGRAKHYEFLQTYDEIDIALDTFPYNGGTTTTEAIWQGLPVITFWGDRWVSRTSSSLLRAAHLGRFVNDNVDEYVALAVGLGNSPSTPQLLAELRRDMRANLEKSSACDTASFARNMEALYRQMIPRQS